MGPSRYGHPELAISFQRSAFSFCFEKPRADCCLLKVIEYFDRLAEKQRHKSGAVNFMVKPNGQLVTVSSTGRPAYTSVLSNWSSTSALHSLRLGDLILGKVSRLYAFSVYPDRTPLPSDAAGATTGSQEVRPPRSSRTKGRPPQISYAHHR